MGIFDRHSHKDRLAYNTNHDTLMSLSPAGRAKLVTYFIAANTGGKLDPRDRKTFKDAVEIFHASAFYLGVGLGTAAFFVLALSGRGLTATTLYSVGAGYLAKSLYVNHAEREFVFRSPFIQELTLKYQFSLFDFHNSKKEVQIGQLVASLMNEDHTMFNTVTD